ncbi:Cyclophilin type peptidyl-prolyl cis-trans isomerase [Perkinsus olseni]|uniref:Cyclophilin type peptidyl-prolyl cis-trans isomerase n=1 Tax=Perkinsus olseni TaxID=32597 RepID=A0A7J6PC46_PEROL|nr:Cyclophilin type peptidyl-prolyl cis-trans isomerase [Perkinsus olseni]
MSSTITIIGNVNCQHYQKVKCLAEFLKKSSEDRIEIRGFFEADFDRIACECAEKGEDRILQFGVKSFEEWVGKNYAFFSDDWQCGDFEENMKANAERDLRDLMNPERSYVRMNFVARENDYNGSVLIEFYDDICPKSCEFLKKKLSESSVTRAVKGGWIQLGEDGGAVEGIARESFAVHHEVGGIIGLCPSGAKPGLYGKELYITTKPLEHLDGNGVAVGRVLEGLELVEKISEIDTMGFSNQKPRMEVKVEGVSEVGVKTGVKDNSDVVAQVFAFSSLLEDSEVIFGPCGFISTSPVVSMVISIMLVDTVYLKFLLSRVFLSAGLYTIVKNDLAWTNLADMSWSSMLDAPFPLPLIWHADKFPPVLHSVIGGLTVAVEIAASLILMASPPAGVFEFLSNVSMAVLAVWSACVGNLNWSILTLLALSVGMIDEEIIAAIVPSIIFTIVVHLPAVLLALKYASLGPVVSRDSVPAGLWGVLATIPGVLVVVYGLVGRGTNKGGFSNRVAATLVAVATAWLIGTTDVVGYDMEGTLSSSILPVPYVRSGRLPEERSGNFGAPVPHTLDGRSALTFHVQAEGMPNPDHSMEGLWELNMPYSVNSDQRPRFLSFHHPRVDYLVWKLHTQEEVEKPGSLTPFLVDLLCTCLAMPEKCGRLAERVLLPKENEEDPRRRLVQDDLGRRALVAFSRKWELTDDKYGIYW